ncbi:MAG TPA: DUF3311 domain-containing protein [Opitutaceae bacterium]
MKKLFQPVIWLAVVPFVATVCTVGFWDRSTPTVLGLPFNAFWVSLWAALVTVFLWVIELLRKRQ